MSLKEWQGADGLWGIEKAWLHDEDLGTWIQSSTALTCVRALAVRRFSGRGPAIGCPHQVLDLLQKLAWWDTQPRATAQHQRVADKCRVEIESHKRLVKRARHIIRDQGCANESSGDEDAGSLSYRMYTGGKEDRLALLRTALKKTLKKVESK